MRPQFTILLSLGFLAVGQVSFAQSCNPLVRLPGVSEVRSLYVQDQRDRGAHLTDRGAADPASPVRTVSPDDERKCDSIRQQRTRELLKEGLVISALDFHDASFIFQHGQSPDDYLLAHVLAMQAVALGDTKSRWIAAATLDRYLQTIGQKQVFGTQFLSDMYAYYLQHKGDKDIADKMKAFHEGKLEDKLTQGPSNLDLVPPTVRAAFCVPPVEQQTAYVAATRSGQPATMPSLQGCR